MRAHILTIAAIITLAAPVGAEPAKAPAPNSDRTAEQPVITLASAAEVAQARPPEQSPSAVPAAKPVRHARVTSCRCGDRDPGE